MSDQDERFSGLAFPVIRVRLVNHRGNGSLVSPSGTIRASLSYSYDQPDGSAFAMRVARATWDKYAVSDPDYMPEPVALIPGESDKGYLFVAAPLYFFDPQNES